MRLGSKHNIRASILAATASSSSLCLDSASLRGGIIKGPGSVASSCQLTASKPKALSIKKAQTDNGNVHSSSGVSSATSNSEDDSGGDSSQPRKKSSLKQRNKEYKNDSDDSEPIYQGIVERDISTIRREAEFNSLRSDLDLMRGELDRTRRSLFAAQDSENNLKADLAEAKKRSLTLEKMIKSNSTSVSSTASVSASAVQLVKRYGDLYSQLRLETLDALDKMAELVNSEELKNKLLFSVVVVSLTSVNFVIKVFIIFSSFLVGFSLGDFNARSETGAS